jgi:hypothetical protein
VARVLILADIGSTPVYALMVFAVTLGVMGHLFRDQRIVGIGIALLFVATALLLLGAHQAYQGDGGDALP